LRILVVEDDPGIADVLEFALTADAHDVRRVHSGAEGLAAAGSCDLVILDVGLPDMDGFEVCRRIRRVANTPVLFLTSRSDEIDRVVGLEIGGDDYITKPFSTRELLARIKAIARRTVAADPGETGLSMDTETFTASWRGTRLDLSRTEFFLLAFLHRQPGRVFTRDQILDGAWPDGGCVTDRTVDAHIKSLRRKLGDDDPIETVRGIGYRLRESAG
jgi:DNA-binding response OmpR family regulator